MDYKKSLYGRFGDIGILSLNNVTFNDGSKVDRIEVNYYNWVKTQYGYDNDGKREDIIIISCELFDNDIENIKNIEYIEQEFYNNKTYAEGKRINVVKKYRDMRLAYIEENNGFNKISEFTLIFCSKCMKLSNVRKEVNNILNREKRQGIAYKIDEDNLKQLELIKDILLDKLELKSDEIYNKLKKKNDK